MLQSSKYKLEMLATPKAPDLRGRPQPGCDFSVTLIWDARVMLNAFASSPERLGAIVGAAIQNIAEVADGQVGDVGY